VGEKSNAGVFDEERGGDYRREAIGKGLAAAILLGSFGGQGSKSGFSSKDLRLACARVGLNWNYTDGALLELENRCFYLHTTSAGKLGKRYWFGTKPTLNKLIVQYRQQNAGRDFEEEILEDLRNEVQKKSSGEATWRIVVAPTEDLPEQKTLTLLILPPSLCWDEYGERQEAVREYVQKISSRCGSRERLYRNTLLFLAPTFRGVSKLRQAHRELAALKRVRSDYWDQLDEEQKAELEKRLEAARRSVLETLGAAYTVALRVRGQEVEVYTLPDARQSFQEHLNYLWTTLVEDEEWILRRVGPVTLQKSGLIPQEGAIRLQDAIEAFLRFTDKPMIASKRAVTVGLEQACADGLVGIGRGGSSSTLQARYCKKSISLDPNEEGVWIIPPFEPEQPKPEDRDVEGSKPPVTSVGGGPLPGVGVRDKMPPHEETSPKRMVKRFSIRGAVPLEDYPELFRCFVHPAAQMKLKKLHLGIQFEMEVLEGHELDPNDSILKSMQEAARQLGLKFEIKE